MVSTSDEAVILVKLFASLAEARGWRERRVPHATGMTVMDIWRSQTGENMLPPRVLCALNMDYCDSDTTVAAGDEVGFFPPVTGGQHGN